MPNWCSNRMYFSGEPAQIAEIKRLASGAVTPLYRRATNEGIQLFLAGSAGLLQTTEDVRFEPVPRTDGCWAWRCIAGEYRVHPLADTPAGRCTSG